MLCQMFVSAVLVSTLLVSPNPVDRSKQTPDYLQTDPEGGLPGNGRSYCGPSSASNALIYLARNGYPKLLPAAGDSKAGQIELIKALAADGLMSTVDGEGTGPGLICNGLKKYVESVGYQISRLEQQSWRSSPKAWPSKVSTPSMDWIKAGLAEPNSAVLLNIGWYKYDANKKAYNRDGGHWITLVGFGTKADGTPDENTLIVHDPSPTAGQESLTQYSLLSPLQGVLNYTYSGNTKTVNAQGFYELKGDFKVKRGFDAGIIDGAVVLVLKPAKE